MASSRKTRRNASAGQTRRAFVHLEIESGPGTGERIEIPEGQLHLGRASTSDFRIDSDAASRHHATLFREGDVIVLRDEDSHNGTFVNEKEIREDVELSAGDRIHIGESILCLVVDGVRQRRDAASVASTPDDEEDVDEDTSRTGRRVAVFLLAIFGGVLLFAYLLSGQGILQPIAGLPATLPAPTTPASPMQPTQSAPVSSEAMPAAPLPTLPKVEDALPIPEQQAGPDSSHRKASSSMDLPPVAMPPSTSAVTVYKKSSEQTFRHRTKPGSSQSSSGASRSRDERRARTLYLQGEIGKALDLAREAGAAGLVSQIKNFERAEGAARAAFSFKKGTEAIQHYEEAFAFDEEIRAADDSDMSSIPGRRVSKVLSNLYLQAGEAFLKKKELEKTETFLERSLDYDPTNVRAREALKKLRAEPR